MTRQRRPRTGSPKRQHLLPREQQQLRPHDWPATNQARWERAQAREDPLDEDGILADSAPHSIKSYGDAYGLFLGWLDRVGELDPDMPLDQRLTPERLRHFILNMRERYRASTIYGRLFCLKIAMCALAPSVAWSWITRLPLAPTAQEGRASRKPVKQVDAATILDQGRRMMDEATPHENQLRAALDFRNGLLLAVQALFTLRLGNLAEIVIGEHLVRRGRRRFLQFQETVKNKADLDYEVPGWLAAYLDTYLTRYRPILLGTIPDHRHLWVCDDGLPMRPRSVHSVFDHHCRTANGERRTANG